jgi:5-formyltetrahydrofolate cyclo-ligase
MADLSPGESVAAVKAAARKQAITLRDTIPAARRAAMAKAVARLDLPFLARRATVSAYHPMGSEFDVLPLMSRIAGLGHATALPVVTGRNQPLRFHAWAPGEPTLRGVRDIPVPASGAAELVPDLLLVPFLQFDRQGFRLGYGAGFYDLTLAALRAVKDILAVGIGFSAQEVAHVPRAGHDQRLDAIFTEREIITCRSGTGA